MSNVPGRQREFLDWVATWPRIDNYIAIFQTQRHRISRVMHYADNLIFVLDPRPSVFGTLDFYNRQPRLTRN